MKYRGCIVLLLILAGMFFPVQIVSAREENPPGTTSAPAPTPVPNSGTNPVQNLVQNITQTIHFPAPSIGEAIQKVFDDAAQAQEKRIKHEAAQWAEIFGEVLTVPSPDYYASLAQTSLPAAGALAAALFLLRLAMHHWERLAGGNEPLTTVFSDWIVAGLLAVISGQFLDILTQTSWWMTGYILGDSVTLANKFTSVVSPIAGLYSLLHSPGLFGILIAFGLYVGGVLAVVAMAFSFAAANSVLYVLAFLGPPLAVISVIPQMRWMRSLWTKAASIVALLPFIAGTIFNAGVSLGMLTFQGKGLISTMMHILWLWGAAGLMLSLAGILGRITLSATTEAFGKIGEGVKGVANVAALGMGAGAAGGGATGFVEAGTASASLGGAGAAPGSEIGYLQQAMGHYQSAQRWNMAGAVLDTAGLPAGRFFRSLAQQQQLTGRQAELSARISHLAPDDEDLVNALPASDGDEHLKMNPPDGVHPGVYVKALGAYPGGGQTHFLQGYNEFKGVLEGKTDVQLGSVLSSYPEDVGKMVYAYQVQPDAIAGADDPLRQAAAMGGAKDVLSDFYGEIALHDGKDENITE